MNAVAIVMILLGVALVVMGFTDSYPFVWAFLTGNGMPGQAPGQLTGQQNTPTQYPQGGQQPGQGSYSINLGSHIGG